MNAHNINDVELSAASIRTAHQNRRLWRGGPGGGLALDILKACANHPLTDLRVKAVCFWIGETSMARGKRV